jgi:hypothetical protein
VICGSHEQVGGRGVGALVAHADARRGTLHCTDGDQTPFAGSPCR